MSGLLILALERVAMADAPPDRVVFIGVDKYAEGFKLVMPPSEWEYLGRPSVVQFVCSGERLAVRARTLIEPTA